MTEPAGLSEAEASVRLARFGPNELPSDLSKSVWSLLLGVVLEPMVGLLLSCAVIYVILGESSEAIPLGLSVFFVIGIGFFQERKSERALQSLRELSSPRALVLRGGRERRIAGREVVPGDVLVVREGDRVPADCRILESSHLKVDESLLTGESLPAEKKDSDRLFSATLVVTGKGLAEVEATGSRTEVGRIGESLREAPAERSRLEKEVAQIVARFAAAGLATSALIVIVYGLTRGDWARGFLAGLSTAMSLLPEEFPLVLAIFLSLGAWRISKVNVLTRETKAIEALGRVSVLCVDKTGTLTWNRMTVSELRARGGSWRPSAQEMPEDFHELVEFGALASHVDAYDPMDRAIRRMLEEKLGGTEHIHRDWQLMREYPLSPELLAISCVWKAPSGERRIIAAKGAPEAIVDLCHLEPPEAERVAADVKAMSTVGLRVLGVARAEFSGDDLPGHPHAFAFRFVGLVGLEDPLREEVPAALRECQRAGIRVVMMTGDHLETARSIARQAGFARWSSAMTGSELEKLDDQELRAALREVDVFARMVPRHKLRIINAVKAEGGVVAMTGDGVNDAPALKWADIGISMGERGTDVAREASDLVLLDDRFSSIVAAIRMGRRVYENIAKAMSYIFAIHVPIAGLAMIPVLFKLPLLLFPAHIVFLELIIDPACTLAFEAEEEEGDVMSRPPRSSAEPAFGLRRFLRASLQGAIVLAACAGLLFFLQGRGESDELVRSSVFSALILSNLGLILANSDARQPILGLRRYGNRVIWTLLGGTFALLVAIQWVPFLRDTFQIVPLGLSRWGVVLAMALVCTKLSAWLRLRLAGR